MNEISNFKSQTIKQIYLIHKLIVEKNMGTTFSASGVDNECVGIINDFGVGFSTLDGWKSAWTSRNCIDQFRSRAFPNFTYDPVRVSLISKDFLKIYERYTLTYNKTITSSGQPNYDAFQENLREMCIAIPGACDGAMFGPGPDELFLGDPVCTNQTRESISTNLSKIQWCGCFVDQAIGINPGCDPICNRQDTIRKSLGEGRVERCTDPICVIDNVTITLAQTQFGGEIKINQVCPACTGSDCICVGSISAIQTSGLQAEVNQACKPGSSCFETNETTGQQTIVPCADSGASIASVGMFPLPIWFYIILGIIILIFLIIGISISRSSIKNKNLSSSIKTGGNKPVAPRK